MRAEINTAPRWSHRVPVKHTLEPGNSMHDMHITPEWSNATTNYLVN